MDSGSEDLFVSTADLISGEFNGIGVQTEDMTRLWKKLTPENVIVDTTVELAAIKHTHEFVKRWLSYAQHARVTYTLQLPRIHVD